jgi:hypothetical protein
MQLPSDFLSAVLPANGWRIFDFIMPGPDGNRPAVQYDFMPYALAEAEPLIDWAMNKGADVYVAIGGFGTSMRTVTAGRRAGEQLVSRKAENALEHRCLRIDIDVSIDPAKSPYATKAEAWIAAKAFITKVGMPTPLVVDSGYGLHVYWLFDRDVPTTQWSALSRQLGAAMVAEGLAVDTTTTEDAARILRLPGTSNFKNGTAVPVRQLCMGVPTDPATYADLLKGYTPMLAMPTLQGALPAAMRGQTSPLSEGLHPPYMLRGLLTGCPGMTAQLASHGAGVVEPLWHATLAAVWKSAETDAVKERVARALSDGHASFSEGGFQQKWQQVQQQNYEPGTCERFANLGMPECQTCPLRSSVKSPVVLGRLAPQLVDNQPAVPLATPVVPMGPAAPQLVGVVTQGIFAITPGAASVQLVDGNLTAWLSLNQGIPCTVKIEPSPVQGQPPVRTLHRIGSYPLRSCERLLDASGRMALVAITFDRQTDGPVRIEFSHRELSDSRAFSIMLHANGVHMHANDVKAFQDKFMPEFLAQLQRIKQANAIAGRCGWSEDFQSFVLGTRLYTAAGAENIRPSGAPEEMEAYHEAGDRTLWREAFDMVLASGPDRQAVVALGIAGPLMAFAGVDGVLLNAYSPESGVGKSTLCDAILSIWGSPNRLRKDYRDTPAATFHLASVSGNMPLVIDEFTNVDGKELSNYVYTITQGRERHRLSSDSKLRANVNRWCLPVIATSNNSVHDKLQNYRVDATAEAARVFEMRFHPLRVDPAAMGQHKRVLSQLSHHYGFMGSELVQLFMSKPEAYWRQMVIARIAWWDAAMAETTGDRFRSVVAALIEIGAVIGHTLGYQFDRPAIVDVVKEQWAKQVTEFDAVRVKPEDFITDYIAANLTKLAVFGGANGDSLLGTLGHEFAGEIRGTIKNHTQLAVQSVAIPAKSLRQFIVEANGNPKAVSEWIIKESMKPNGMVERVGQMTFLAGTPRSIRLSGYKFSAGIMGITVLSVVPSPLASQAATTGATP